MCGSPSWRRPRPIARASRSDPSQPPLILKLPVAGSGFPGRHRAITSRGDDSGGDAFWRPRRSQRERRDALRSMTGGAVVEEDRRDVPGERHRRARSLHTGRQAPERRPSGQGCARGQAPRQRSRRPASLSCSSPSVVQARRSRGLPAGLNEPLHDLRCRGSWPIRGSGATACQGPD